jgi:hypothetical protein
MSNWSYFGGYAFFQNVFAPTKPGGDCTRLALLTVQLRCSEPAQKLSLVASVLSGGMAGITYW